MSLFCLLWIPLFYFLWRSITVSGNGKPLWAFLLGCASVAARYFLHSLVKPEGFGFSRWMSGFVDIVGLPVIIPLAVCVLFVLIGIFPRGTDYAGFMLVWLIPIAAYRAITWGPPAFPHLLVLVPPLWTAQCIGISFFVDFIFRYNRWYMIVPSALGAAAVSVIAASCWWAFFSQQTLLGFILLFISVLPATVITAVKFFKKEPAGRGGENF